MQKLVIAAVAIALVFQAIVPSTFGLYLRKRVDVIEDEVQLGEEMMAGTKHGRKLIVGKGGGGGSGGGSGGGPWRPTRRLRDVTKATKNANPLYYNEEDEDILDV